MNVYRRAGLKRRRHQTRERTEHRGLPALPSNHDNYHTNSIIRKRREPRCWKCTMVLAPRSAGPVRVSDQYSQYLNFLSCKTSEPDGSGRSLETVTWLRPHGHDTAQLIDRILPFSWQDRRTMRGESPACCFDDGLSSGRLPGAGRMSRHLAAIGGTGTSADCPRARRYEIHRGCKEMIGETQTDDNGVTCGLVCCQCATGKNQVGRAFARHCKLPTDKVPGKLLTDNDSQRAYNLRLSGQNEGTSSNVAEIS